MFTPPVMDHMQVKGLRLDLLFFMPPSANHTGNHEAVQMACTRLRLMKNRQGAY